MELGNSPFETNQGPANFGMLKSARNCKIHNGSLGRSSHHAIHGNSNVNILIENVRCFDFEVAGIHLNNPKVLKISHVQIGPSSCDVPVRGRFSAANFILPLLRSIPTDLSLKRPNGILTVSNAISNLEKAVKDMHPIFQNPTGLNDGTVYGILINRKGVAVHDFAKDLGKHPGDDVAITNVCVENLKAAPKEITAIRCDSESCHHVGYKSNKVMVDPFGSVFDIDLCMNKNNIYVPNALADAQLLVYKHLRKGNINDVIVKWAEEGTALDNVEFVHGMDSMAHVIKGNIGIFMSGVRDFNITNCLIDNVLNDGFGDSNGIVITGCQNSHIKSVNIRSIIGKHRISGVRVAHSKNIVLNKVYVSQTSDFSFLLDPSVRMVACIGSRKFNNP